MLRTILRAIPVFCATGCGPVAVDEPALCAGLAGPVTAHAAALAGDGGPRSVATGARLVRLIDAGCGRTE